ncbi:hypothetical protein [Marinobacter nauticus]|uniref:hypothetical protein n=1 Tax=Marinobacter nauticus TaxID=2743 RepID=UPI004044543B
MFEKNRLLRALIAAGLTSGLVACGGGSSGSSGGGDTPPNVPPTSTERTGQFVDSPVAGLEYRRTSEGAKLFLTDENGYYKYLDGETVTFGIGQYTIGSVKGQSLTTPKDLGDNTAAMNVARVLQTLDDDQDPTNGITISVEVRSKASEAETPRDISKVLNLETIAAEILDISSNNATALVSQEDAGAHLEETLNSLAGSSITSCDDPGAQDLSASDFNNLTLGMVADDEILIFKFAEGGNFTEYNSGDNPAIGAVAREGEWSFVETGQTLSLVFTNEYDQLEGEAFKICDAGNKLIAEPEDGTSYLFKLNTAIDGDQAASTYLLQYPDETGAVMTLNADASLDYLQGEDKFTTSNALQYQPGMTTITWGGSEPDDQLYFLAGQATRTAIYVDFGEDGSFARLGVAKSTDALVEAAPTAEHLIGKTHIYRSDADNDLVIFEFKSGGVYTDIFNDSYNNDVRNDAGVREGQWAVTNGELTLTEQDQTSETFRVALAKNTMYYALKSESDLNSIDINRIDAVSLAKPLTRDSFVGSYSIDIPTEDAVETLIIHNGDTCSYSGTGCNWDLDENGKAIITFGSGNDAIGYVWQMANRANGYAFVMTHQNDPSDVEPGFMTRL